MVVDGADGIPSKGMRAGMSEFADLPEYVEPAVQTKERTTVRDLTAIRDTPLDTLDANVAACMICSPLSYGVSPC